MNLIVCIDDMGGMSFGGRRQSKDRAVYTDIRVQCLGARLFMNAYSAKQFEDAKNIVISESPLSDAQIGDYCFVENLPVSDCGNIETLIIYRWNRRYGTDNRLDIDLSGWRLLSSRDFAGSSHEKITKEVYTR